MSSFFLKFFALIFMIVDHIGYILFPNQIIFRAIGRLALPLFSYQMAVGFSHTKNKKKHILKLLLFAIICQLPYTLMINLYNSDLILNIIFTFVFSLLLIYAIENIKIKTNNKINIPNCIIIVLSTILLLLLSTYLKVDYSWYGVLLTVIFYFTLNKKHLSFLLFFLLLVIYALLHPTNSMAMLNFIGLFDITFIMLFNGKKGYNHPQIFYLLYFLHLFPILIIKYMGIVK